MTRLLQFVLIILIFSTSAFVACTSDSSDGISGSPEQNNEILESPDQGGTVARTADTLTSKEQLLVQSDNAFSFSLFQEIINQDKNKNIFISPLSVAMALGMTLNGADGDTREAMEAVLRLSGLTEEEMNESYESLMELLIGLDPEVIFQIANSIWYRQGNPFNEEFLDLGRTYFDAEISGLDFTDPNAVNVINAWVDENTNGKIKEIVDKIEPSTVIFLINAIYFKGTWTSPFDEKMTRDALFTLLDGSQKTCRMMHKDDAFEYFENSDMQVIDLPYGDGNFSMTIILPKPEKNIDHLVLELNATNWSQIYNSLNTRRVILGLPKFKLEYELKLNDVLKALGMGVAFDPYSADFTRMYESVFEGNLFIDEVKHKTFIAVNEAGAEAAAVTSVTGGVTYGPPSMVINRPFIFMIRENVSQTILFMGKIVDPVWE